MKQVLRPIILVAALYNLVHAMEQQPPQYTAVMTHSDLWWCNLGEDKEYAPCPTDAQDLRHSPLFQSTFRWLIDPLHLCKCGSSALHAYTHDLHAKLFAEKLAGCTPEWEENMIYKIVWSLDNCWPEACIAYLAALTKKYPMVQTAGLVCYAPTGWLQNENISEDMLRSTLGLTKKYADRFNKEYTFDSIKLAFPILLLCDGNCNKGWCNAYRYYKRLAPYWFDNLYVLGCKKRASQKAEWNLQRLAATNAFYHRLGLLQNTCHALVAQSIQVGNELLTTHQEAAKNQN